MKIFADENVEAAIVSWLRAEGHDVVSASELYEADPDEMILRRAADEGRVVFTSDLDFGEHVFRNRLTSVGLVLMRIKVRSETERLDVLRAAWGAITSSVAGHFIVLTKNRMRRRPLP